MSQISFSGIASGIDGDAIIKALTDSKRLTYLPIENQIEERKQETSALEGFSELMLQLNSKLSGSMTLAGGALTRSAQSSNSEAVTATASNNAAVSSLTVNVHSIASTASFSFDDRFSSATEPIAPDIGEPTKFSITIGQGDKAKKIELEITNKTTLDNLASQIIDKSGDKALANIVNVGTPDAPSYLLMVNGSQMGTVEGSIAIDTEALAGIGLFQSYSIEQATDAKFFVSGIGELTRPTNQIGQLIPGLSIELKQAGTGPTTISVDVDKGKSADKVREMIDILNGLIKFSKDNSKIERIENQNGASNIYGSLARTKVDEQAIEAIRSALFSAVSSNERSSIRMYADLGITTSRDGTLAFDIEKFNKAIAEDPRSANQILSKFADSVSSVNGIVYSYTSMNGQIQNAIKSNASQTRSAQETIDRAERAIQDQAQRMKLMFANLEAVISRLNSEGDALMGMISTLSTG